MPPTWASDLSGDRSAAGGPPALRPRGRRRMNRAGRTVFAQPRRARRPDQSTGGVGRPGSNAKMQAPAAGLGNRTRRHAAQWIRPRALCPARARCAGRRTTGSGGIRQPDHFVDLSARTADLRAGPHHGSATLCHRWRPPGSPAARSSLADRGPRLHECIGGSPGSLRGRDAERFGVSPAVVLGQHLTEVAGPVGDGAVADLTARDRELGNGHGKAAGPCIAHHLYDASPVALTCALRHTHATRQERAFQRGDPKRAHAGCGHRSRGGRTAPGYQFGAGGSGRLPNQRRSRKARSLRILLPNRATAITVSTTAVSVMAMTSPSRGWSMPMPKGMPSEAAPVTAGRQGTRARAEGDAPAAQWLTGPPLSSRPGGDEAG
jgi:hypothetical protein